MTQPPLTRRQSLMRATKLPERSSARHTIYHTTHHPTRHATYHTTHHKATITTWRVRASISHGKSPRLNGMWQNVGLKSGDEKWQLARLVVFYRPTLFGQPLSAFSAALPGG